jgi:hypothetical protein
LFQRTRKDNLNTDSKLVSWFWSPRPETSEPNWHKGRAYSSLCTCPKERGFMHYGRWCCCPCVCQCVSFWTHCIFRRANQTWECMRMAIKNDH